MARAGLFLVHDLLDLDRLSRGIIEPNFKETDVGELVLRLVRESDQLLRRKVETDVDHVVAAVDPPKVERIVENLLANSAKHVPTSSHVWVTTREVDGGVLIVIEDDGPGVAAEVREALRLLQDDEDPYQLVLLDCPPSLGKLTRSALVAADRALLVTEPMMFAVAGVQRAFEAVQAEREHNEDLQPLGVVVNRVRPRMTEHEYRLAELRDLFGPLVLNPPLPDRAAVSQAQGAGVAIHQWPTAGAREIAAMFDALLERLMRSAKLKSRV